MKLIKRQFGSPIITMNIWLIPTLSYVLQKSLGVIISDKEWYWWLCISLALLGWMTFNFKLVKNK